MNQKYRQILRHLYDQNDWTSSTQLSNTLGISKRSVKSYIAEINSMEEGIIISSSKGYKIVPEKLDTFLHLTNETIPQTPKERIDYLLRSLINSNEPLNIFDLSDELYVSEVTVKGDMRKAKQLLKEHHLDLKISGEDIQIIGEEKNKRKLMSIILYSETNDNFLDIEKLKLFFEGFDIDYIRDVISEVFSANHYFTNDYSLTNVIVHIAIAINRMKNGFVYSHQIEGEANLEKEYIIAAEIAAKLEEHFGVQYSAGEIRDLSLLISSRGTSINFMHLQLSELQDTAGQQCMNLVNKILKDLKNNYYIVIDDTEFLIRFTLHIKNLLMRLENNYVSKNPLTSTIKINCPSIYDCAVHVSYTIKEETGYTINDDEIAYIAFHLGYALEVQKQANSKITCSILFPFYYNYSVQLKEKITGLFEEDLLIQHIVTNESELSGINSDLVISTVQLNALPKIPCVIVNPLFTESDKLKVANKISFVKESRKKESFKTNLDCIMDEQLFEITHAKSSKEDVINMMCKKLESIEYVDSSFLTNVLEREAMSSTAFGRIALPHAIKMDAKKTGMFVLINDKGIEWEDSVVNIVLLLSVKKEDRGIFYDVFESLASIMTVERNVSQIITATDYQNFIHILVDCY